MTETTRPNAALRIGRVLLATTALVSCVSAAAAQSAGSRPAAAPPAAASGRITLDTITLQAGGAETEGSGSYAARQANSATGLALSVRETPQSVSVVTDQQIRDQGLRSTREVLNTVTGVTSVQSETDRTSISARGYSIDNYIIDGVQQTRGFSFFDGANINSSTASYDRVEVLRGATGLLTGTGEPGAAVSITRKRANARQLQGQVDLRYGSWNRFGGTLDIGTPLNADGSVRGRFVMDLASEDSYFDRYHVNRQTYYAAIDADLTPSTRLSFSLEHRNHDPRATMWGELPAVFSDGTPTRLPRSFSVAPDWGYWASDKTSANVRLEHEFDNGWTADASLGLTLTKYDAQLLYIHKNPDPVTGEGMAVSAWTGRERNKQISLDTKVSGPVELFGRAHKLSFGVSHHADWMQRSWPGHNGTLAPVGSIFDFDGSYPQPDWKPFSYKPWARNVTRTSAYASGRFSLTDPLTVIVGGRYTDWKSDFEKDNRHFAKFTPFAGVVYDLNDQWSVYGSYTSVFNPQSNRDRYGKYIDPVVGRSYELGAKGELFDGRMNATVALFDTLQNNAAIRDGELKVPGTNENAFTSADGIRTRGIEVEFAGEIRDGWNLFVGASALRMRTADDKPHQTYMPTRSLKLFTTYKLPGNLDKWTVGGGARWQNKTWFDITGGARTLRVDQPGFAVVDVMARYDFNDRWAAQMNVENVFDKTYYGQPQSQVTYGPPRNAMLTLVSKF